jgi:hypothetical protein
MNCPFPNIFAIRSQICMHPDIAVSRKSVDLRRRFAILADGIGFA